MRFNGKKFQSAGINASAVRERNDLQEFGDNAVLRQGLTEKEWTERVEKMASRFDNGEDLFSGESLSGIEAEQWLALACEAEEREESDAVCFA